MKSNEELKSVVKERYAAIATMPAAEAASSCCGTKDCGPSYEISFVGDDYSAVEGHVPDADLGLGCGVPTEIAGIREGDTVLDLGSGAGNDAFIARKAVGDKGKVIGVDMTEAMILRAEENKKKLGASNVEFLLGEIENLPVESDSIDVVLSNCVLNLVPDKTKAFSEIFRVLKPGAHFSISDIVTAAPLPEAVRSSEELYAGCVSGAMVKEEYLGLIMKTGFQKVQVKKEKKLSVGDVGITSITVYGEKPARR